jgi:hypothetical protein
MVYLSSTAYWCRKCGRIVYDLFGHNKRCIGAELKPIEEVLKMLMTKEYYATQDKEFLIREYCNLKIRIMEIEDIKKYIEKIISNLSPELEGLIASEQDICSEFNIY